MIENLLDFSKTDSKSTSWNYASFEILDPLGFHARPIMFVLDTLTECPGQLQIALSQDDKNPASANYVGINSIMETMLHVANSSGRFLNIRYDTKSSEMDRALEVIREGVKMVWPKNTGRRYG